MGMKSRTKGASGEREVAKIFAAVLGEPVKRRSQADGADLPDIDVPGLWVEVKRYATMTDGIVEAGLAQASRDAIADPSRFPVCVWRGDRQPWRATVRLQLLTLWIVGPCAPALVIPEDTAVTMTLDAFVEIWRQW